MPQMAPLLWLYLFFFFLISLSLILILNSFIKPFSTITSFPLLHSPMQKSWKL